jgi:hypothetical protein
MKERIKKQSGEQLTAYPDDIAVLKEVSLGSEGVELVDVPLSQIPQSERSRVFETIKSVQGYIKKGLPQLGLFMGFDEGENFTSILVISATSKTAKSKFISSRLL